MLETPKTFRMLIMIINILLSRAISSESSQDLIQGFPFTGDDLYPDINLNIITRNNTMVTVRQYTKEDDNFIRSNYKQMSVIELGKTSFS